MNTLIEGYNSLSADVNKVKGEDTQDYPLVPELELEMTDEELLELSKDWLKTWGPYAKEIEKKQKDNEDYWLGKQFAKLSDKNAPVDNLIFESLETFLPIATRPKMDPTVESDDSPEGEALKDKVRKMLVYISDKLAFNLKLKQVVRYWALYHLGVMKVGWSMKENDITCLAIRPQKIILDPNATIEECEYTGYYIGEIMEDMASNLVIRFPKMANEIKAKVQNKMGTKVEYIMWMTDDYVFWTMGDKVLGKNKNPNWNYETTQPGPMDEFGNPGQEVTVPGKNHFNQPKKPYIFFSVFSLGLHPHDETNLIQQNLPLQDLINKRLQQIDKNADNANGGLIVSGDAFTEEQAQQASKTLRKGGAIWVPTGPVDGSVKRDVGAVLPNFVYESLIDYRNELRNIFGTRGSTPQGSIGEQTVRGKLIIKGQDSDRIGGGISTYLEQFSDRVMNWFVQLMYVHYDEPHAASVLGAERAREYITLSNSEMTAKLMVGVKEGSMVPHDPVTERNEAIDLWSAGGIDPITFFDRLEFPNPREAAKQLFLWKADPIQLFPDLAQQAQQQQMAQQQQQQQQMAQQQMAKESKETQKGSVDHERELQKIQLQALSKLPR